MGPHTNEVIFLLGVAMGLGWAVSGLRIPEWDQLGIFSSFVGLLLRIDAYNLKTQESIPENV